MLIEEQVNHIPWCLMRFSNVADKVDHNQYFSRLNHAKHISHNAVAIPMMSFQCDKQAFDIVHCTVTARWRLSKLPSYDAVPLWMGTGLDRHF